VVGLTIECLINKNSKYMEETITIKGNTK